MCSAHPVEDVGPALHGDALEDGQHGEADVVEGGDAAVGARPLLLAHRHARVAGVRPARRRGGVAVVARNLLGSLRHDLV